MLKLPLLLGNKPLILTPMNPRLPLPSPLIRFKKAFERGMHVVYTFCILPRAESEDDRRQEFVLNTILCGLIFLLMVLTAFITLSTITKGDYYSGIPILTFVAILAVFMYLLLLSRSGYYKIASYIVVAVYFISTTYGAIRWGAELPLVAISYVVTIVISSILISTRFAFVLTLATAASIISITYLQLHDTFHPTLDWKYAAVSIHDPI
jgi:hypothetical protein